jgi:hypothetical protein
MTTEVWLWALAVGAAGGAINAVVARHLRLLPLRMTLPPGTRRIVNVGLLANSGIGAVASGVTVLGLTGADSATNVLLPLGSGLFTGFVCARWMTNEADKAVLRAAVCKATAAPAADPETVHAFGAASPLEIYETVDALLPRRARYR